MKCVKKTVRHYWKYKSPASGYRQLQDITNSGTQRINTGINAYNIYGAEVNYTANILQGSTSYPAIVESNRDDFCIGLYGSVNTGYVHIRYGEPTASIHLTTNNTIRIFGGSIQHNGAQVATYTSGRLAAETNHNAFVFGNRSGGAKVGSATVRYLKFFDNNGDLLANFVPCERISDGVLGLYDTVNNSFKENIDTGTFTTSGYVIEEGTSSDYDYYTDEEVALLPSNIVRHYWKYVNTPLQQPVLTSNGELGGNSFAVSSSYTESGHPAYYLLDGNSSSYYSCYLNDNGNYYTFYNPNPFKIDTLAFVFKKSGSYSEFATTTIEGSNDGVNWTSLEKSWNSNGTMTVNNNVYYKYYRIYQRYYWTAYSCTITATEQTIAEGTSDDYDFYTDDEVYYGINQ